VGHWLAYQIGKMLAVRPGLRDEVRRLSKQAGRQAWKDGMSNGMSVES
jgi:hypothetical protein